MIDKIDYIYKIQSDLSFKIKLMFFVIFLCCIITLLINLIFTIAFFITTVLPIMHMPVNNSLIPETCPYEIIYKGKEGIFYAYKNNKLQKNTKTSRKIN